LLARRRILFGERNLEADKTYLITSCSLGRAGDRYREQIRHIEEKEGGGYDA
jgi:hypothetical protein